MPICHTTQKRYINTLLMQVLNDTHLCECYPVIWEKDISMETSISTILNTLHSERLLTVYNMTLDSLLETVSKSMEMDCTSASKPAKNIETLVNHSGQIMGAGQINMSGGQGIPVFNVFFAPFAAGLSYERVKQAMQMWVFNQNMSYVSRGGQAVFSNCWTRILCTRLVTR